MNMMAGYLRTPAIGRTPPARRPSRGSRGGGPSRAPSRCPRRGPMAASGGTSRSPRGRGSPTTPRASGPGSSSSPGAPGPRGRAGSRAGASSGGPRGPRTPSRRSPIPRSGRRRRRSTRGASRTRHPSSPPRRGPPASGDGRGRTPRVPPLPPRGPRRTPPLPRASLDRDAAPARAPRRRAPPSPRGRSGVGPAPASTDTRRRPARGTGSGRSRIAARRGGRSGSRSLPRSRSATVAEGRRSSGLRGGSLIGQETLRGTYGLARRLAPPLACPIAVRGDTPSAPLIKRDYRTRKRWTPPRRLRARVGPSMRDADAMAGSLRERLLEDRLRIPGSLGQPLRGTMDRRLGVPLLRLHEEDGLVELRVARDVLRIRDVVVLQEGGDQRIDQRVVRMDDLDLDRGLLLLNELQFHERGLGTGQGYLGFVRGPRDSASMLLRR